MFDVWSHHPYTSGGPTHNAVLPDDVSLGDLPEMRRVLDAAVRSGSRRRRRRRPLFWVTEFSWDSSPPDPYGVPTGLHTRWVAEGLYRMWRSGVTLVTWLATPRPAARVEHAPVGALVPRRDAWRRPAEAGAGGVPVPVRRVPARERASTSGAERRGPAGAVLVEQQFRGGWKRLGIVRTNAHGIFHARFATNKTGFVRARTADRGERAVPFSLEAVPDRLFNPFGGKRPGTR